VMTNTLASGKALRATPTISPSSTVSVVHCLRALCAFAENGGHTQIGWGGTGERQWQQTGRKITLRFTAPQFRDRFIEEAKRLLPAGSWRVTATSDSDPAKRQRSR
jgi:hypothetical protein